MTSRPTLDVVTSKGSVSLQNVAETFQVGKI